MEIGRSATIIKVLLVFFFFYCIRDMQTIEKAHCNVQGSKQRTRKSK